MAKSRTEQPKPLCMLREDYPQALAKLERRLNKGRELQKLQVHTAAEYESFDSEHRNWNDYNETLLVSLFTTGDEMTKYRWSVAVGGILLHEESFHEKYTRAFERLVAQCRSLESLIGRLEVIPLSPDVQRPSREPSDSHLVDIWTVLHPRVRAVAEKRFNDGHYADAAEAALKALNGEVQRIAKERGAPEMDGARLMRTAFSPSAPIIVLADQTTQSGKDMQQGYMDMFAGAMSAVRNPKAHGNVEITPERGLHFLFLSSMLWYTLDDRH